RLESCERRPLVAAQAYENFRLIPHWNETRFSGSLLDWKMLWHTWLPHDEIKVNFSGQAPQA
ncbi:MAG: hypothetical protein ABSD20_18670, partial [Terriglobales bacterium]